MFKVLFEEVMPNYNTSNVDMLFQNVPQPWHAQSSYMHEVALAVKLVDESKFYPACQAIFAKQEDFFDSNCMDKTRMQIYDELIAIVASVGVDPALVKAQVELKGDGNAGNECTLLMKFAVKYHRVRSIHVTPTVLLNGIEAPDVGSGWTAEQWKEKIDSVIGTPVV
eukprot:CAMPEP_0114354840 /NCGR_PEP_ID=MMETSP0101-20121206/19776_1 /TAXON_ID=38822 ORGANISM="Pteridomonas danica, Strain PT" /NCGR_SAMPLE_ID=MMETSP0101 /ASSEMBLY_ACC=CAM_ASM_000211 /LENGTH=166 /DNA_ID=CAMNT_0001496499 /DNA_START=64 /DNA_END=564 /DNA_ORIENTATION=-